MNCEGEAALFLALEMKSAYVTFHVLALLLDLWRLLPKHCEKLIHMVFVELHFIALEVTFLQLAKVLDTSRSACLWLMLGAVPKYNTLAMVSSTKNLA